VLRTTPNLLRVLGVQPAQGRMFSAEEAEQRQHLSLISDSFWKTHFAGSPDAIGATIELDGVPSRIIGILPGASQFPQLDSDVWEPHTMLPDWETTRSVRGVGAWFVIGRLHANVSIEQAQSEMSAVARRLDEQLPASERNRGISVVPLKLQLTGTKTRLALWMLWGAVF